jgi:hypothetical protein
MNVLGRLPRTPTAGVGVVVRSNGAHTAMFSGELRVRQRTAPEHRVERPSQASMRANAAGSRRSWLARFRAADATVRP